MRDKGKPFERMGRKTTGRSGSGVTSLIFLSFEKQKLFRYNFAFIFFT
jgi:hypothetical protein